MTTQMLSQLVCTKSGSQQVCARLFAERAGGAGELVHHWY